MSDAPVEQPGEYPVPPGWYAYEESLRYWDGEEWTEHYAPPLAETSNARSVLWGLAAALGAAGAAGVDAPVVAYYWPLGLGAGGLVAGFAAFWAPGNSPWYAPFAVLACVVAIVAGIGGYGDLQDAREGLDETERQLEGLGAP